MRAKRLFFAVGLLFPLVSGVAAHGQPADPQAADCLGKLPNYSANTLAARIDACTRLIDSGTLGRDDLENAYVHRGFAYGYMGKDEEAVLDFTRAIQILPADPDPYMERATHLAAIAVGFKASDRAADARVNFNTAIADLSRAIQLTESDAQRRAIAYCKRSLVYSMMGESEKAKSDSADVVRLVLSSNIKTPAGCGRFLQ
jgi:tetratricopeptide (TPR) repeat protein